jgi:hypothetical protein
MLQRNGPISKKTTATGCNSKNSYIRFNNAMTGRYLQSAKGKKTIVLRMQVSLFLQKPLSFFAALNKINSLKLINRK